MKIIESRIANRILGGQETKTKINEMHRETYINRAKSAKKIHNKILQHIMS